MIFLSKNVWWIVLPLIFTICAFQRDDLNVPLKVLLNGHWSAMYDTTKINISFSKSTGVVEYLGLKKKYNFNYAFKNDSIIKMWSGKTKPEYHIVKKLTKDKLVLRPYPNNPYQEDISLINAVDFKRVR